MSIRKSRLQKQHLKKENKRKTIFQVLFCEGTWDMKVIHDKYNKHNINCLWKIFTVANANIARCLFKLIVITPFFILTKALDLSYTTYFCPTFYLYIHFWTLQKWTYYFFKNSEKLKLQLKVYFKMRGIFL